MSLDSFIIVDSCTNKFFPACDAYLVDRRKLSEEDENVLFDHRPSPKTKKILDKYGMDLESCEYHKIMKDAEEVEETMKIDLEEFVGKEVIITLRNGEEFVRNIAKIYTGKYEFAFYHPTKEMLAYDREGVSGLLCGIVENPFDIVKIEIKQPQQPQNQMTKLSDATIQKLADALFSEALTYIETDEEYYETVVSVINRFLIDRMGQMDEFLLSEMCVCIFEKINITSNNK